MRDQRRSPSLLRLSWREVLIVFDRENRGQQRSVGAQSAHVSLSGSRNLTRGGHVFIRYRLSPLWWAIPQRTCSERFDFLINAACLRASLHLLRGGAEGNGEHAMVYMWGSMGQRDRSVRRAELPLQQRRCCPRASHTPAAGRIGWRVDCLRNRSDLPNTTRPTKTKQKQNGGCIEGWDGGQMRCFPEGTSLSRPTLTLSLVIEGENEVRGCGVGEKGGGHRESWR